MRRWVAMKAWKIAKRIGATAATLAALDSVWLGVIMNDYYKEHLGELARRNDAGLTPDWTAVILVYVALTAGLNIFAVDTKSGSGRIKNSLIRGALFGLISYGIYDLTNMATLKGWSWEMTVADMLWGTFLCSVASAAAAAAAK